MTWIVYHNTSAFEQFRYDAAPVVKRSDKQITVGKGTSYNTRLMPSAVVAEFDTEAEAMALHAELNAIRKEYEHSVEVARVVVRGDIAKAIEAQRAETAKTGSVEDESAVSAGDLPK